MEGKCLLFKYLGGVDAVPITLDTKDPEKIIETVLLMQPAFGGINLEDISHPKCFDILDRLREEAEICIFHDDQQGTATVILAALINALKVVGKKMNEVKVAFVGSGAACVATARLLFAAGVDPRRACLVDSKGILHRDRKDISGRKGEFKHKWHLCETTNERGLQGGAAEALEGADVCIAMSKSEPGTIKAEWVRKMAKDSILFPLANPLPEIWPWVAREAGARIIATGRSDFPNQVNNSNGFPAIFRGALDVRAKTITDEMCLAAADSMAKRAEESGLHDENITPNMNDLEMFCREAVAVGMKAQEQEVAQLKVSKDELYRKAKAIIERSQNMTQCMMKEGFIPKAD
jgi:malate dehydrogenase (oxaloacetate-decarboxylating)